MLAERGQQGNQSAYAQCRQNLMEYRQAIAAEDASEPALESGSALGRHFGIAKGPSSTPGQQSTGSLLDTEGHPRPSKHHDVLVVQC